MRVATRSPTPTEGSAAGGTERDRGRPATKCSAAAAPRLLSACSGRALRAPQLNTSPLPPGVRYSLSSADSRSSGVRPRQSGSARLASARSSAAAMRSWPPYSARCSGDQPLSPSGVFGSAPASSSASTSARWLRHTCGWADEAGRRRLGPRGGCRTPSRSKPLAAPWEPKAGCCSPPGPAHWRQRCPACRTVGKAAQRFQARVAEAARRL